MLYLMNSPVLTGYGSWTFEGPLSIEQARALLESTPHTSAIGHEATADFLSTLLGQPVLANRIKVEMQPDDQALILRLKTRLPEGMTLTHEQMRDLPFELGILTRTA